MVPQADHPSDEDINHLHQLIDKSTKLVVLTGAGITTECGLPDYRSRTRHGLNFFLAIAELEDIWHQATVLALKAQAKLLKARPRKAPLWAVGSGQWAAAIDGSPGSDKTFGFGMKQRPDGDIEIDEKFWEEDPHLPEMQL
ncbi:hypothetical protein V6N12_067663 [Hibiscus sabdariffa]|uniref:Deacetylase sirtuin-type domain-containing protein n=1 Tax=Hibiscus sabdariffa TaxID=183260 RepID=A0ABR2B7N3_9ROSI